MDFSKYTALLESANSNGEIVIDRESLESLLKMHTKKTRAPNSFILWKNANKEKIREMLVEEGVDLSGKIAAIISKKAGEVWRSMSDEEKSEWKDKSNILKEEIEVKKSQNPGLANEPKKKRGRGRPKKVKEPEEVEVERTIVDGEEYLVDKKTSDVYNEDGVKIGKYSEGKVTLN